MDCKDGASHILGQPMCLEPFSKNGEGSFAWSWMALSSFAAG